MKLFIRNHSQDFSFFPFRIFSFSFLKMCYHFQNSSLLLKLLSIKLVFSNQKKYTNPEVNNQQSLKTLKKYSQILSTWCMRRKKMFQMRNKLRNKLRGILNWAHSTPFVPSFNITKKLDPTVFHTRLNCFNSLKSNCRLPKTFLLFTSMESPLKMMKNVLYFSRYLKFLSLLFGHVGKPAWLERWNSKFMTSQPG